MLKIENRRSNELFKNYLKNMLTIWLNESIINIVRDTNIKKNGGNKMKEFAIKLGWDLLEFTFIIVVGIVSCPYILKAFEWFIGLYGYHL